MWGFITENIKITLKLVLYFELFLFIGIIFPLLTKSSNIQLHGQILDTSGNPRQAYVIVSTYLGSDLSQGQTDLKGNYRFNVPEKDHYVIWVQPIQRLKEGKFELPTGFLDIWKRVNRENKTDLNVDIIVQPAGTLLLDAYDPQGKFMYRDDYPDPGLFAIYPIGTLPVHRSLQVQNHQMPTLWGYETANSIIRNPAVILLPSETATPFTIWGLWRVPNFGTIMVEMDNGGQGFSVKSGQLLRVNIPYEIALTEFNKASKKLDYGLSAGFIFSSTITGLLGETKTILLKAKEQLFKGNNTNAAVTAYTVLSSAIQLKEEITMEIARQNIERNRKMPVSIIVNGPDGKSIQGVKVNYCQVNHDFLLSSNWGGDSAVVGDTPATSKKVGNYNFYAKIAKEIGFEILNYPPQASWWMVQAQWPLIPFIFSEDVILRKMTDNGFRASSPGFWFLDANTIPNYVKNMDFNNIKSAAMNYTKTTVSHYGKKIHLWNLINEPNLQNCLNFTSTQMLDFIKTMISVSRESDNQAIITVVLTSPGLEPGYMGESRGSESPDFFIPTYDYLDRMLHYDIYPDAIGIQFYYGVSYPSIDVGTISDLLDIYDQDFDIPFFIEELEFPSHDDYPNIIKQNYKYNWHQGYTDQTQADWAVALYTLGFSKKNIIGVNWSYCYDMPEYIGGISRMGDGYLHADALTLRPMASALHNLFYSWTTKGTSMTDKNGYFQFYGFAGDYLFNIIGNNGAVLEEKIHIREGQNNSFTIVFDEDLILNSNRKSAEILMDKTQNTISWANNLNKTYGLSDAKEAFNKVLDIYNTGHYWNTIKLSQDIMDILNFQIDGNIDDWEKITPLFVQTKEKRRVNGTQLMQFRGAMDNSNLYLVFEFDNSKLPPEFLFEMDTNNDSKWDYHIHTSPMGSYTIFTQEKYAGTALAYTHEISSIDVIYKNAVEMRIPLSDLGKPTCVKIFEYRESNATSIPYLATITAPLSPENADVKFDKPISDFFEGTILNTTKWVDQCSFGGVVFQDDELIASTSVKYNYSNPKIITRHRFLEDFYVQVDYRLGSGWMDSIVPSGDSPHIEVSMGLYKDDQHWIHITRIKNPGGEGIGVFSSIPGEGMLNMISSFYFPSEGKFRIVRKGSQIIFSFKEDMCWTELYTNKFKIEPVYIYLSSTSVGTKHAFTAYFDNFLVKINSTFIPNYELF